MASAARSHTLITVVHLVSAAIGVFLLLMWLVGVQLHATVWMTWLLGVAGAVAVGIAIVDREEVSRVARAQSLVCFGLMLYAAAFAGWSRHVAHWQWTSGVAAATAALVVGLITLASADRSADRKDQLCR